MTTAQPACGVQITAGSAGGGLSLLSPAVTAYLMVATALVAVPSKSANADDGGVVGAVAAAVAAAMDVSGGDDDD